MEFVESFVFIKRKRLVAAFGKENAFPDFFAPGEEFLLGEVDAPGRRDFYSDRNENSRCWTVMFNVLPVQVGLTITAMFTTHGIKRYKLASRWPSQRRNAVIGQMF